MKKYNKIIAKELKRILPYHLLGVILHTIVIWYNRRRIYSSIGYRIPNELENETA